MDDKALVKNLAKACQSDIDIFKAYQLALEQVDVSAMYESLRLFQEQHLHHIEKLNHEIRKLGGIPVKNSLKLRGLLTEGYTLVRSATGTEGALKAMHLNERLILTTYQELAEQELPAPLKILIRSFLNEEQKHIQYIELLLSTKPWNPSGIPYQ